MRGPTFLIIGAARCGSTSLAHLLAAHPDIFMPSGQSEPKFFSREQEYSKGAEYYLNTYFRGADRYPAAGEKSTEYMENHSSALRIYRFNPALKLICILRHPVDRAVSNYWWSVGNGLEERPVDLALRQEWEAYLRNPAPVTRLDSTRPHAYIDRSLYYLNLLPFYDCFPTEQIMCLTYESFVGGPSAVAADVFNFLGVRPVDLAPGDEGMRRAAERKKPIDPSLCKELWQFFRDMNRDLPSLVGRDVWRQWTDSPN